MLAVKCTELLGVADPSGVVRASAEQLAAAVPATQWIACSAGHGAKGRRLYDWIRVDLAALGMSRWLLVLRGRSNGKQTGSAKGARRPGPAGSICSR